MSFLALNRMFESAVVVNMSNPSLNSSFSCKIAAPVLQFLLKSINQSTAYNLIGYDSQKRSVIEILKRTINSGVGNSLIIIGPKGSGKSSLIKAAIDDIFNDVQLKENCLLVNLNGYLQTDDRICIKEISRQLQLENCCGNRVFGSFAENLSFLLDSLKTGGEQTKCIFFVLDEFDLFCHHHNQTLLYNLFDISQSSQTPVAVIGLTRRLDVMELLEKRVKSRFSHRQILLMPNFTFQRFVQFAEQTLRLQDDFCQKEIVSQWNNNISTLLEGEITREILRKLFDSSKDIASLKTFLALTLYKQNVSGRQLLSEADFVDGLEAWSVDSKQQVLSGVSVVELCLLLCIRRLVKIHDGEAFNFEMVHREYVKFSESRSSFKMDKRVVRKAFENLIRMELVSCVDGVNSNRVQKGYKMMNLLLDPTQIMTALQNYPNVPTEIEQWAATLIA